MLYSVCQEYAPQQSFIGCFTFFIIAPTLVSEDDVSPQWVEGLLSDAIHR